MRFKLTFFLSILLTITTLVPCLVYSQTEKKSMSSKEVFEHFDQLYKVDARLISGDFYQTPLMNKSTGHPYFLDTNWKPGSVVIDNICFDSLLLRYDIHSNQLIINTVEITNSYLQLILKKDGISSFTMGKHLFRPCSKANSLTGTQFCEVLAEGEIDFLLKKTKSLIVANAGLSDYKYTTNRVRSLLMNKQQISYHGRRTIYNLYPELKNQLRDFIRKEHLRFRRMSLDNHIALINYCNTLLADKK